MLFCSIVKFYFYYLFFCGCRSLQCPPTYLSIPLSFNKAYKGNIICMFLCIILVIEGVRYFTKKINSCHRSSNGFLILLILFVDTIKCLPSIVQYSVPESYKVKNLNCVLVDVCKDCS